MSSAPHICFLQMRKMIACLADQVYDNTSKSVVFCGGRTVTFVLRHFHITTRLVGANSVGVQTTSRSCVLLWYMAYRLWAWGMQGPCPSAVSTVVWRRAFADSVVVTM